MFKSGDKVKIIPHSNQYAFPKNVGKVAVIEKKGMYSDTWAVKFPEERKGTSDYYDICHTHELRRMSFQPEFSFEGGNDE